MLSRFEELDYQDTPLGELILRRRHSPSVPDEPVYEVKINGEMLMSSSVNASERALATLILEGRRDKPCTVLVGGLGLGYTAAAALDYANVSRLVVVEFLAPVIGWHRRRLVPMSATLLDDPRCSLVEGDFFAHVGGGDSKSAGPDGETPGDACESSRYDVILLDIDHAPDSWLRDSHREFYSEAGLDGLIRHMKPGGVFGLWSASEPSVEFLDLMRSRFPMVQNHEVSFPNRHLSTTDTNWVIMAELAPGQATRPEIGSWVPYPA